MADLAKINSENDLKLFLHTNYMAQIKNFFGDEKRAMKFLSSVMADVQRNPKLLDCTPMSVVNSYMMMAQMGFMPSGVSGEAYVLPYAGVAQFQLGYKGIVTLLYGAGVQKIIGAVVREKDKATLVDDEITHEVDMSLSREERGPITGAYVKAKVNGEVVSKYMNIKDIYAHAKKFSKSFDLTGKYSPWNPVNDPEGWMPIKTVLIQTSKLLPRNDKLNTALAADYKDSIIADRLPAALESAEKVKMGNFLVKSSDEPKTFADEVKDAKAK